MRTGVSNQDRRPTHRSLVWTSREYSREYRGENCEEYNSTYKSGTYSRDDPVQSPEEDDKAGEEENEGDLEERGDRVLEDGIRRLALARSTRDPDRTNRRASSRG